MQRCGRCKVQKDEEGAFSPSYRGVAGTWCRDCVASSARGNRGTAAPHEPMMCSRCGGSFVPKQLKASTKYCSRRCGELARKESGRQRDGHLQRKYGIGQSDYDAMLDAQGGGCAICGRRAEEQIRYTTYLHVDHCHDTGKIRGLLCDQHNLLLGRFDHDPDLLRRAADYLEAAM